MKFERRPLYLLTTQKDCLYEKFLLQWLYDTFVRRVDLDRLVLIVDVYNLTSSLSEEFDSLDQEA
jgi:hypothetical protein